MTQPPSVEPRKVILETVLTRLEEEIKRAGSLRACARKFGVSAAYLSDVRRGFRHPGVKILRRLGIRRTVRRITLIDYFEKSK